VIKTTQFKTFHEMVAVLAANTPHALVMDWWARLEGVIRTVCGSAGIRSRLSVAGLIDNRLSRHLPLSAELIAELHGMRRLRNECAHGEAPCITAGAAAEFAHRAWSFAWLFSSFGERMSSNNAFEQSRGQQLN
jgi:hypothetical protein